MNKFLSISTTFSGSTDPEYSVNPAISANNNVVSLQVSVNASLYEFDLKNSFKICNNRKKKIKWLNRFTCLGSRYFNKTDYCAYYFSSNRILLKLFIELIN